MNTYIFQEPEGTHIIRFPWKEERPNLSSNHGTCKRSTCTLVNKLRQAPEFLRIYGSIIREQDKWGFIENVDDANTIEHVHYLTHDPIKKDSPTTSIQIVCHCSCHGNSKCASPNDRLMVGPPFLNDLCAILLHFHDYTFALSQI